MKEKGNGNGYRRGAAQHQQRGKGEQAALSTAFTEIAEERRERKNGNKDVPAYVMVSIVAGYRATPEADRAELPTALEDASGKIPEEREAIEQLYATPEGKARLRRSYVRVSMQYAQTIDPEFRSSQIGEATPSAEAYGRFYEMIRGLSGREIRDGARELASNPPQLITLEAAQKAPAARP